MNYAVIGSNGFAQVGDSDYHKKADYEMCFLLTHLREKFPIPEPFKDLCSFSVKTFEHDFGYYSEIVLYFSDDITKWSLSKDEDVQDDYDEFWDWVNQIECYDLESPDISESIRQIYQAYLNRNNPVPFHLIEDQQPSIVSDSYYDFYSNPSRGRFRCSVCGDRFDLNDEDEAEYEEGYYLNEPDRCYDCAQNFHIPYEEDSFSDADPGL